MQKIICTLLLDSSDNYVLEDGTLPKRPMFDKALLETFVEFENLSEEGYHMLPPSLRENCSITHGEPYPVTIPEIDALADIIIITRNKNYGKGKRFRFDKFERIVKTGLIEIYRRKV